MSLSGKQPDAARPAGSIPVCGIAGVQDAAARKALEALRHVCLAILETIGEAGADGAPAGMLFVALQAHATILAQHRSFMSVLTGRGFLHVEGQCYTLTEAGLAYKTRLVAKLQRHAAPDGDGGDAPAA